MKKDIKINDLLFPLSLFSMASGNFFVGSFMAASGLSKLSRLRQGEGQKEVALQITAVSWGGSALRWSIDLHCCIRQWTSPPQTKLSSTKLYLGGCFIYSSLSFLNLTCGS